MKKILLSSMYRQIISLKKEFFTVSSSWNETYKLPAHSLERTICLFWKHGIGTEWEIRAGKIFIWQNVLGLTEIMGNKGREEFYLTKHFITKTMRNILSNNCQETVKQLWLVTFIMTQETLRSKAQL